jgi:hypothetical protein
LRPGASGERCARQDEEKSLNYPIHGQLLL